MIGDVRLLRPFKYTVHITQPFGPTDFTGEPPAFGYAHFHLGVDYAMPVATCVLSPAPGTITRAAWDTSGFGNTVLIDHGGGVVSLLGHLSAYHCSPGNHVNGGELVAASGNTGNSTGPHLHWSTLLAGVYIDPARFVFAVPG